MMFTTNHPTKVSKRLVLLFCLGLVSVGLACSLAETVLDDTAPIDPGQPPSSPIEVGAPAPDFSLENTEGEVINLTSLRGQPVILNFFATWCGPCNAEMPDIQEAYQTFQSQGLLIIGVNLRESKSKVNGFIAEYDLTFPILMDRSGEVSEWYSVEGIPTSVFLDPQGIIREIQLGSLSAAELEQSITSLFEVSLAQSLPPGTANQTGTPAIAGQPAITPGVVLRGCVSAHALNVRTGPNTTYPRKMVMSNGECAYFDARDQSTTWLRLTPPYSTPDQLLWLSAKHIELEGDIKFLPIAK